MKYKILIDIQHQAMDFVEQDEPQPNNRWEEIAIAIIKSIERLLTFRLYRLPLVVHVEKCY
ncbi:hypothetical protein DSD29_08920 [Weissella confusa]|nr:hypothetical protein [Weissella confusa]